jgi:DNA-binding response OmpR family regulator
MILVTPELDIPVPFSLTAEEAKDLHARAQAAFNTVEFLTANGMQPPAVTAADKKEARAQFFEAPTASKELNTAAAVLLKGMLDEYDVEVVRNAAQVRNYVKMRLLMLTGSDKESTQLKALELLGKMSDVGAFAERVDINITHRTTEELQAELATKLSAYMDNIIDVESKPLQIKDETYLNGAPAVQTIDLDEELGMTGKELDETDED